MLYKIGDMARLLGISKEALRLYERRGMIKAIRDEETGYRYYEPLDMTSLIRCRSYRRYGFTMNETTDLMTTKSLDFVVKKYKEREEALEKSIFWDQKMLEYLRYIRGVAETIPTDYMQCRVEQSPPLYRFEYMSGSVLSLTERTWPLFSTWMDKVPFAALSIVWSLAAMLEDRTSVTAGLCIPAEVAVPLEFYLGEPVQYFPARKCVYTLASEDRNRFDTPSSFRHVREYMAREGLTPVDDPYCRTFLSWDKGGNYTRFRQVWTPVG